jgi:Tol biopolymer transport system component
VTTVTVRSDSVTSPICDGRHASWLTGVDDADLVASYDDAIMLRTIATTLGCSLALGLVVFGPDSAEAGSISTDRVSVSSSGVQANGASFGAVVSGDGRFVAFTSSASNLSVHPDTNGVQDVFVRDRIAGTTRRVSVSSKGGQANGPSWVDAISADGRFVVFRSDATDLAPHDTNHRADVFVRDLSTGQTLRISDRRGVQGQTDAGPASISPDGRFVIFRETYGTTCGSHGIFVRDRLTHTLLLVSRTSGGRPMCTFPTPCGRFGQVTGGHVSANGQIVTFEVHEGMSDCSRDPIAVIRNRATGDTHFSDDFTFDQDLSPDGRFVTYGLELTALNLLLHDRVGRTTATITDSTSGVSTGATVSDDGALVAFDSTATGLIAGDTNQVDDVFLRDVAAGTTTRVSVTPTGGQLNRPSSRASISADGRYVVLDSRAGRIVPADSNDLRDVFIRGPLR